MTTPLTSTAFADLPDILTVGEVAAYLRVNPATIYGMVKGGGFDAFKVGTQWRIPRAALEQQQTTAIPQIQQQRQGA